MVLQTFVTSLLVESQVKTLVETILQINNPLDSSRVSRPQIPRLGRLCSVGQRDNFDAT